MTITSLPASRMTFEQLAVGADLRVTLGLWPDVEIASYLVKASGLAVGETPGTTFTPQLGNPDSATTLWTDGFSLYFGPTPIGAGGAGTVVSVGLSLPSIFSVTVSPVTASGTLTAVLATQAQNLFFAGPALGAAATPTFRAMEPLDLSAGAAGGRVLLNPSSASMAWTAISGDATLSSGGVLTLATILAFGGPTGSAGVVPVITWDQKGRLTAVTTAAITPAAIGAVPTGPVTTSGLTMSTARLLGRSTAATGAIEEITIGTGLSLAAGVLTNVGPGSGTCTSVGLSLPGFLTVTVSPITTSGTLTAVLATQTANTIFAGPASGVDAAPTFRAAVPLDVGAAPLAGKILIAQTASTMTWQSVSSDATLADTGVLTLASVIVAGGPTGSTSVVPVITYDAKGRLTAVTSATITPAAIGAVPTGAVTTSGLTMSTARLLGRTTAATGAIEEISVSGDFTLAGGILGLAASGVSGSGIAGQLTYWTGASTIAGDTGLTYNSATDTLTTGIYIGNDGVVGTPSYTFTGQAAFGIYRPGGSILGVTDASHEFWRTDGSSATASTMTLSSPTSGTLVLSIDNAANPGATITSSKAVLRLSDTTTNLNIGAGVGVETNLAFGAAPGSATNPAFAFVADANTGMYNSAPDTLAFTAGGTNSLTVSSSTVTVAGKLTVTGLIDPTGLQLTQVAANPGTADTVWIDSANASWTVHRRFLFNASTTAGASIALPHGAVPTSPVNGDMWTTSAGGLFVRINGVTVGPLGAGGGGVTGAGVAGQAAYWDGVSSVAGTTAYTFNATDKQLTLSVAAVASANTANLMVGSGGFAGTAPNFVGSASGTYIAVNADAAFAGSLLNLQTAGVSSFNVVSTASSTSGLKLTPGAGGANITFTVTDSAFSHVGMTFMTKGFGSYVFDSPSAGAGYSFRMGGFNRYGLNEKSMGFTPLGRTTGSTATFSFTSGNDTTLTASVEAHDFLMDGSSSNKQHATGALATERDFAFLARTHTFVGASTLTTGATLAISGAPIAGTNATITVPLALWVQDGASYFAATPTATANRGVVNAGNGAIDGATSGFFVGSATGTVYAANVASTFTGSLIDVQTAGTSLFKVTSVSSGVTGLQVLSAVTGGGVSLSATGTATNEDLTLNTKGAGSMFLNCPNSGSSAAIVMRFLSTTRHTFKNATVTLAPSNRTTGSLGAVTEFTFTGDAATTMDASTEVHDVDWNLSATKQWNTGAITSQRDYVVKARTYGFVGASTVTTGATLAVSGAPTAGTNATITVPLSFWVQAGSSLFGATPTATANRGVVNAGNGAIDGATAGKFVGLSSGTVYAANVTSTFTGALIDLQNAGGSLFRVTSVSGGTSGLEVLAGVSTFVTLKPIDAVATHVGMTITTKNNGALNLDTGDAAAGVAIRPNGANTFGVAATYIQNYVKMIALDGTAGTPAYGYSAVGGVGMYRTGGGGLGFSVSSAQVFGMDGSSITCYQRLEMTDAFNIHTGTTTGSSFGNSNSQKISVYGVTPIVRALLATGAGATVDDVITALQNFGLVKQS